MAINPDPCISPKRLHFELTMLWKTQKADRTPRPQIRILQVHKKNYTFRQTVEGLKFLLDEFLWRKPTVSACTRTHCLSVFEYYTLQCTLRYEAIASLRDVTATSMEWLLEVLLVSLCGVIYHACGKRLGPRASSQDIHWASEYLA